MSQPASRCRGFTLVEIIVVLGIIAVLAGLLLPALGGAQRRSKKMEELSRLRQVGQAWLLYANANDDAALPGFVDGSASPSVMDYWRVRYWYPDRTPIPEQEPFYGEEWPWRLAPYLGYNQEMYIGHLEPTETSQLAMKDDTLIDEDLYGNETERPLTISEHPGFGYNAYYVGGWWEVAEVEDPDGSFERPMPRFWDARRFDQPAQRVSVVARSQSSIHDTSRFILFCSSSMRENGTHHRVHPMEPGAHFVVPPILADNLQWQEGEDPSIIEIPDVDEAAVPIGRYTDQVAVLHADLHSEPHLPGELDDQRYWINVADTHDWQHRPN